MQPLFHVEWANAGLTAAYQFLMNDFKEPAGHGKADASVSHRMACALPTAGTPSRMHLLPETRDPP